MTFDAIVVGSGMSGGWAAKELAERGLKVLVIERGNSVGGAASSYKAGDLFIEASLHTTSGPGDVLDPKHRPLARADQRVIIPMASGVESLNVGAAVAVCLFEQARQTHTR